MDDSKEAERHTGTNAAEILARESFHYGQDGTEQSVTVLSAMDNCRLLTWLQNTAKSSSSKKQQ